MVKLFSELTIKERRPEQLSELEIWQHGQAQLQLSEVELSETNPEQFWTGYPKYLLFVFLAALIPAIAPAIVLSVLAIFSGDLRSVVGGFGFVAALGATFAWPAFVSAAIFGYPFWKVVRGGLTGRGVACETSTYLAAMTAALIGFLPYAVLLTRERGLDDAVAGLLLLALMIGMFSAFISVRWVYANEI